LFQFPIIPHESKKRMWHPALLPERLPVGRAFSDGASGGATRLHEIIAKRRTALDGALPALQS
jgi:hypothetical protein